MTTGKPESEFPTIADLVRGLSRLVDGGLGDLPVQILVVPDSTLQAIARSTDGFDPASKAALMIDLESSDGRMCPSIISTERLAGRAVSGGTH